MKAAKPRLSLLLVDAGIEAFGMMVKDGISRNIAPKSKVGNDGRVRRVGAASGQQARLVDCVVD